MLVRWSHSTSPWNDVEPLIALFISLILVLPGREARPSLVLTMFLRISVSM